MRSITKPAQTWHEEVRNQLIPANNPQEADSLTHRLLIHYVEGYSTTAYLLNTPITATPERYEGLNSAIKSLQSHKPIQQILGYTDFCGHRISLTPDVLIPRPETEEMVSHLIKHTTTPPQHILDICTGSGCIAIALQKAFPRARVEAIDIDKKALAVAKKNATTLGAPIHFYQSDILTEELPEKRWDMMVSNPPYIPQTEQNRMHPRVVAYEPHIALFVQEPLIFYQRIAQYTQSHLAKKGTLYLEIHEAYGEAVRSICESVALQKVTLHQDLQGKNRWVSALRN